MSLCGKMFEILRKFISWFAPKEIEKPECVLKLLESIYPTIDWTKGKFYDGLPWFTSSFSPGTDAITLPGTYGLDNIHIYFKNFDPCTCEGMATIIHEGFHVLQYNDIGSFGVGWVKPYMVQYFACCFKLIGEGKNCYNDHPMEEGAKKFHQSFSAHYCSYNEPKYKICDCSNKPPTFNQKELDEFVAENPELVKETSDYKYECGFWYALLAFIVLTIIALLLPVINVVFVIATIILFIISVFLCVLEWIWDSIKAVLDAVCKWTTIWEKKCVEWAKETKEECKEYRDEGYEDCSKWKEEKTKKCCTWWPCSWLCKAWTWIVSTICVAWVWVSSMVCIAWVTIVSWVCKATAWVIKTITCW